MARALKDPRDILSTEGRKGARGLCVSRHTHCTRVYEDLVHFSTLIEAWKASR